MFLGTDGTPSMGVRAEATESTPNVRVTAKRIDIFILNSLVEELKGSQQSRARCEAFYEMLFPEKHAILFNGSLTFLHLHQTRNGN